MKKLRTIASEDRIRYLSLSPASLLNSIFLTYCLVLYAYLIANGHNTPALKLVHGVTHQGSELFKGLKRNERNGVMRQQWQKQIWILGLGVFFMGQSVRASDFGAKVQALLEDGAPKLFGVESPLAAPATDADVVARESASANDRQLLAEGLEANFVARNVSTKGDMITFWPNDIEYTHLIVCIEQTRSGTTTGGADGLNASVQRM